MGLRIDVFVNGVFNQRAEFLVPPRVDDRLEIEGDVFAVDEVRHNVTKNRLEVYATGKAKPRRAAEPKAAEVSAEPAALDTKTEDPPRHPLRGGVRRG